MYGNFLGCKKALLESQLQHDGGGVGLSTSVGHASAGLVAMETDQTRRSGFRAAELLHFAIREIPRTISEGGNGCIKNCLDGRTKTL
jgi:hypothetical protein